MKEEERKTEVASRGGDALGQHRREQLARTCITAGARGLQRVTGVVPREPRAGPTSTKTGLTLGEESE